MIPGEINVNFLKKFRRLILRQYHSGKKFIIVAGGGKIARNYQAAAKKIIHLSNNDSDWLGIHSTRLNAHLLRTIFKKEAAITVLDSEKKPIKLNKPIAIAAGWQPGWSTDYIAIRIAKKIKAKSVIIAGKPAYVYNKDNQKYPDAKPFKTISWPQYQKLIPKRWTPGLSSPVDPVGAKYARRWKIKAHIIKGTDLKNLEKLINGKKFVGTTIQ